MRNTVRILSALLAALLMLSLIACGQNVPADTGKAADTKANDVSKVDTAAKTEGKTEAADTSAETYYTTVGSPKNAGAGDVIVFGSYEQDGDTSNGKEPLEWLVLERNGDSLLIITLYAVESGVFNTERDYKTWETSTVRAWLNGEFFNTAFTADEKTSVKTTTVTAEPNPEYPNLPAGGDTEDKVFLLSIQEAERYFKDGAARMCSPTEALVNGGGFTVSKRPWYAKHSYACLWWLRSPGMDKLKIAYVDKGGSISVNGSQIDYDNKTCIRPAVWIVTN